MKLLLDQGLPRAAAGELRARGFDVLHTGEVGLAKATDGEIVDFARIEGRTILTLDADFHALLALSNAGAPSVVRIRIEGLRGVELAALAERVLEACANDLRSGAMVTVDERNVRVRALPLVR